MVACGGLAYTFISATGTAYRNTNVSHALDRRWSVTNTRENGDITDDAALARSLALGYREIYWPAGEGLGPNGNYLIETDYSAPNMPYSGLRFIGDGIGNTIIQRAYTRMRAPINNPADYYGGVFFADSGNDSEQLSGLSIIGISIIDPRENPVTHAPLYFSEFSYLIAWNGVANSVITQNEIYGFRGDGVYIGAGLVGADKRKNSNVTVCDNVIDGIDRNCRNGVSVVQGRGIYVYENAISNTTRPGGVGAYDPADIHTGVPMPGGVDVEPNADAWNWVQNVGVENNIFTNCTRGFAFLIKDNRLATSDEPNVNIWARGNAIYQSESGFKVALNGAYPLEAPYNCDISGNVVDGATNPFFLDQANGLTIQNNQFLNATAEVQFGYDALPIENTLVSDNSFIDCGAAYFMVIAGSIISNTQWQNNTQLRCGINIGYFKGKKPAGSYLMTVDGFSYINNTIIAGGVTTGAFVYGTAAEAPLVNTADNMMFGNAGLIGANAFTPMGVPNLGSCVKRQPAPTFVLATSYGGFNVTGTGGRLGDFVLVSCDHDYGVPVIITAKYYADDAVRVDVYNGTAFTIDLSTANWYIRTMPFPGV